MAKAPDDKPRQITINVESAGALVVGDDASVAISMDGDVSVGTTLSPKDAVKIDTLINDVASARGTTADEIKDELAKSLGIADIALITKELNGKAIQLLTVWKERLIREAVNGKTQ